MESAAGHLYRWVTVAPAAAPVVSDLGSLTLLADAPTPGRIRVSARQGRTGGYLLPCS